MLFLTNWGNILFSLKKQLAGLAQLVEHLICNQRVEGSSPLAGIKNKKVDFDNLNQGQLFCYTEIYQ